MLFFNICLIDEYDKTISIAIHPALIILLLKYKTYINKEITNERRRNSPSSDGRGRGKLSYDHLQIIKRFSNDEKNDDIRDKENSTAIFVCCKREPPNVAKSDGHCDARHEELYAIVPVSFIFHFFRIRTPGDRISKLLAGLPVVFFVQDERCVMMLILYPIVLRT